MPEIMKTTETINLADIRTPGAGPALDRTVVRLIEDAITDRKPVPVPRVLRDEKGACWLAEGAEVVEAYRSMTFTRIDCLVRAGSREDAVAFRTTKKSVPTEMIPAARRVEVSLGNLLNPHYRRGVDAGAIADIASDLKERAIDGFSPDGSFDVVYVGDGWHYVEACRETGRTSVAVNLRIGSERDALLHGLRVNGLYDRVRYGKGDKRHAIWRYLALFPGWHDHSNRAIWEGMEVRDVLSEELVRLVRNDWERVEKAEGTVAEVADACGVDPEYVVLVRATAAPATTNSGESRERVNRKGRKIRTEKIGAHRKAASKVAAATRGAGPGTGPDARSVSPGVESATWMLVAATTFSAQTREEVEQVLGRHPYKRFGDLPVDAPAGALCHYVVSTGLDGFLFGDGGSFVFRTFERQGGKPTVIKSDEPAEAKAAAPAPVDDTTGVVSVEPTVPDRGSAVVPGAVDGKHVLQPGTVETARIPGKGKHEVGLVAAARSGQVRYFAAHDRAKAEAFARGDLQ